LRLHEKRLPGKKALSTGKRHLPVRFLHRNLFRNIFDIAFLFYRIPMRFYFLAVLIFTGLMSAAQNFPAQFIGHWEGELQWFQTGKKEPQKVKMQLTIKPADTVGHYTWQLVYGEKSEDDRPYILKPVDTAKGHWVVDELNGIILDQYWVGNRFTSAFTVQNSTIIDSYWLENGNLVAEFYSVSSKPINTTGSTNDDIPAVYSYATKSYQKAILKKKMN
jgi:hypothetical protein